MYLNTVNTILSHHEQLMQWDQPFLFKTENGIVDLSSAIGKHACTPSNASNQPEKYPSFRYSKHNTFYRFDPGKYLGMESHEQLMMDVRSSLTGAKYYNKRLEDRSHYSVQELNCLFRAVTNTQVEYKEKTFMKSGTLLEPDKQQGQDLFPRMDNAKLKKNKSLLRLIVPARAF